MRGFDVEPQGPLSMEQRKPFTDSARRESWGELFCERKERSGLFASPKMVNH